MRIDAEALHRWVHDRWIRGLAARPEVPSLTYTFDMPLAGDGWHTRESDGGLHWRFTGERASLYLPRCAPSVTTIELEMFHAVTAAHAERLAVAFNGVPLADRQYDGRRFVFAVPPEAVRALPYTRLDVTTLPAVQVGGDDRKVGIAFLAVWIV